VRALIALAVAAAACSPRVIDLGKPAPDAPPACVCLATCQLTGSPCLNSGMCGSNGYCNESLGTCTSTTPLPCNAASTGSKCMASVTSTLICQ
jgi:hypothetical protein